MRCRGCGRWRPYLVWRVYLFGLAVCEFFYFVSIQGAFPIADVGDFAVFQVWDEVGAVSDLEKVAFGVLDFEFLLRAYEFAIEEQLDGSFEPYTAAEVEHWRRQPIREVVAYRRALLKELNIDDG